MKIRTQITGLPEELSRMRTELSSQQKEVLTQYMQLALSELARNTPVDTGEAASSWSISGMEIVNDEDYIVYLNDGSSIQAPAFFIESILAGYGDLQFPVVENTED